MQLRSRVGIVTLLLLLANGHVIWAQKDTTESPGFAGDYNHLHFEQKLLVDDWFQRFSAVVHRPVNPEEGYGKLPLSTKTTFNAVTHALLMTKLTDSSGESLGESGIDLVDKVESVAGQIRGARGDQQFRIYVQMKPDAVEVLNRSTQFKRTIDNTVFHKGYPTCYRSIGGSPSIQVSLTRNGTMADIDVDYRSAKFPVFLVNGHLAASNSDVRAGNNDARHNGRWAGLQNWWRNLLGLPLQEKPQPLSDAEEVVIPRVPLVKESKPADAIYDFLNTWLVESKPENSVVYFDEQAYDCMEVENGKKVDRGMAKYVLLQAMQDVNHRIGQITSLSEASVGVRLSSQRARVIQQPHHAQFVLYDVREDLAEEYICANQLNPSLVSQKAMKSTHFGKYVGAVFNLKSHGQSGETVATIWRKDGDYWKMISFDVEPEFDRNRVPDLSPPLPTPQLSYVAGDKDMIRASKDFLNQWLIKKDVESALGYISAECVACANLYREEDTPALATPAEARELLKNGMTEMAADIGKIKRLDRAMVAAQPNHPDLKLVRHANDRAYVVVSLPDSMADAANCKRRKPGESPNFNPTSAKVYGNYYATGFSRLESLEQPAVLWIVWGKVSGSWKAVSYVLLTP